MSRRPRFCTAFLAVVVLSIPALSLAQATDAADWRTDPGKVSVGLNVGVLLGPSQGLLVAGPNVTFNSSRRSALQISTSVTRIEDSFAEDMWLVYAVQYRRTVRDTGDSRRYWSVGGVGLIDRQHTKAQTYALSPSHTITSAVRTHTVAVLPVLPVAGFGIEKFVKPRLAIRGDVVISFLVVRAAVGVSVPLGRLK